MITLTRLTGAQFALNPDLVERVDRTPDTVITLVDGTKYLVREPMDAVVDAVLSYRAMILATAAAFERSESSLTRRTRLTAVPAGDEVPADALAADETAGPTLSGGHPVHDGDAAQHDDTDRRAGLTVLPVGPRTV